MNEDKYSQLKLCKKATKFFIIFPEPKIIQLLQGSQAIAARKLNIATMKEILDSKSESRQSSSNHTSRCERIHIFAAAFAAIIASKVVKTQE